LIQCIIAVSVVIPFPAITKYKIVQARSVKAQITKSEAADQIAKEALDPEKQELDDNEEATDDTEATDRGTTNPVLIKGRKLVKQDLDDNNEGDDEPTSKQTKRRSSELAKIRIVAHSAFGSMTNKLMLLVAVILGIISRRRKYFGILLLVAIELYGLTLVPVLRGMMLDIFGKSWIVNRMLTTANLYQHVIMVGGWLVCLVDFATRRYVKTVVLPLLIVLSSLFAIAGDIPVLNYSKWFEKVNAGFLNANKKKAGNLKRGRQLREALLEHIPEGSAVLMSGTLGYKMAVSFSGKLVYTDKNRGLIPDAPRRKEDLRYLLSKDTDQSLRRMLFQRYGIKYWVYIAKTKRQKKKNEWTSEYGKVVSEQYGVFVLQIK
jgi:hypothetical protein